MIDGRRGRERASQGEATPRARFSWLTARLALLGEALVRRGITANQVTAFGVFLAGATAVLVGFGYLYLGVVLLTVGGLMDTLDGVVAKAAGTSSKRGAFVDSVADRVSDGLIFAGVAWYFLDGRDPKAALLPIAILAISGIVSYTRAKAESLGFSGRGGLMERAERLILLGVALFFHVVIVPLLLVLLVLTSATAIGRFRRVWREASDAPARARPALEGAWRDWRERRELSGPRRRRSSDLQPSTTRRRGVLRTDEHLAWRMKRSESDRARSGRALRQRFETEH